MKASKETRRLARELLRGSFKDGRLDAARVSGFVRSMIEKKPRDYVRALEMYQRLLRLEVEKRHATIESASALDEKARTEMIGNLKRRYGNDLTTEFRIKPELLGGMRIRVGSDVWDSSVQNRLQRLQQQL